LIVPEFIVSSTAAVMLSALVIVIPFGINNLVNERYLLGGLSFIISGLSVMSAISCNKGKYNWGINLFLMVPIILITIPLVTLKLGTIGTFWAFLAVLAFYFILTERIAWISSTLFIVIMIPVSWTVLEPEIFARFVIMLIVTSAFAAVFIRIINDQHDLLAKQAVTDPMTGLYNRSLLQNSLELAIHQHKRRGIQMSLIMLDVDHFKSINDDLGHAKGDQVIVSLGKLLKESFRATDKVFRVGGEEFLILVHGSDEKKAHDIAEKLRKDTRERSLIPERRITISLGVSGIQKSQDWSQWMKHCDNNLYRAKSAGRNIVIS